MITPKIRIVPPETASLLQDLPYGTVVEWQGILCFVAYGDNAKSGERQLISLQNAVETFDCSSDFRLQTASLPILGRLEVANDESNATAHDDGIDWKARAEKFEGWLKRMLESWYPPATRHDVEREMRKDGLL